MEKNTITNRLLSEVANKLKTGFSALICRLNTLFPRFNTPLSYMLDSSTLSSNILTIPANTAHYISYSIIQGSADITINGITNNVPACFSETIQATDLITHDVVIEAIADTPDSIVYITVMYP